MGGDSLSNSEIAEILKPCLEGIYKMGFEKGFAEGEKIGFAAVVFLFLKENPDWTDREAAQMFKISERSVKNIRASGVGENAMFLLKKTN
jgi:hypothetical protein